MVVLVIARTGGHGKVSRLSWHRWRKRRRAKEDGDEVSRRSSMQRVDVRLRGGHGGGKALHLDSLKQR